MASNMGFMRKFFTHLQQHIFNSTFDPEFSFAEFVDGAKMAYTVIRQLSSNVKDPAKLEILKDMVSPSLLEVLSRLLPISCFYVIVTPGTVVAKWAEIYRTGFEGKCGGLLGVGSQSGG